MFLRRTRLALLAGRDVLADGAAARRVADALAPELGWGAHGIDPQLDVWAAEATAEGVVGSA